MTGDPACDCAIACAADLKVSAPYTPLHPRRRRLLLLGATLTAPRPLLAACHVSTFSSPGAHRPPPPSAAAPPRLIASLACSCQAALPGLWLTPASFSRAAAAAAPPPPASPQPAAAAAAEAAGA